MTNPHGSRCRFRFAAPARPGPAFPALAVPALAVPALTFSALTVLALTVLALGLPPPFAFAGDPPVPPPPATLSGPGAPARSSSLHQPASEFSFAVQELSPDSGRPVTTIVVDDAVILLHDAVGFFTAPLSFGRTDVDRLIAGAGATAVLMAMDEPLNDLMIGNPPPEALDGALDWGDRWGELRTMQYASLGLYAGGLALREDGVRVTGRLMGEALLLAGIPAITLQYVLGRSRPYSGKGAFDYNFFEWSNQYQSLPSGHMTVAFAMSTVLAKRIDRWWASVPLYGSAGLTALSLAWGNQHWASDIFVGAALGYLAGSFVVGREEARAAGKDDVQESGMAGRISAGVGPRGLTLVYTF